jgi:hypothetical protein
MVYIDRKTLMNEMHKTYVGNDGIASACALTDYLRVDCEQPCGASVTVDCEKKTRWRSVAKVRRTTFQGRIHISELRPDAFVARAMPADYTFTLRMAAKTRPFATFELKVHFCTQPLFFALESPRIASALLYGMPYRACLFCAGQYTPPKAFDVVVSVADDSRHKLAGFTQDKMMQVARGGGAAKRLWLVIFTGTVSVPRALQDQDAVVACIDKAPKAFCDATILVTGNYGASGLPFAYLQFPRLKSILWRAYHGRLSVRVRRYAAGIDEYEDEDDAAARNAAKGRTSDAAAAPERRRRRVLVAEISTGCGNPAMEKYAATLTAFAQDEET